MIRLPLAGMIATAAGVPVSAALPIDNTTPPMIALSILFLIFLLIYAKLNMEELKVRSRNAAALEGLAVEMARGNIQQAETNKRLDELCQKISSKPCLMENQNVVEDTARRIGKILVAEHVHIRSSDIG